MGVNAHLMSREAVRALVDSACKNSKSILCNWYRTTAPRLKHRVQPRGGGVRRHDTSRKVDVVETHVFILRRRRILFR
jgi:hypothetical protein